MRTWSPITLHLMVTSQEMEGATVLATIQEMEGATVLAMMVGPYRQCHRRQCHRGAWQACLGGPHLSCCQGRLASYT